jgi:hypothetical protein
MTRFALDKCLERLDVIICCAAFPFVINDDAWQVSHNS